MTLATQAYQQITGKEPDKEILLKYSGHFKGYNASISSQGSVITVRMSRQWKNIDSEIKTGLIQELLVKLLKIKKNTHNIEMYNNFIKNLHWGIEKTKKEPVLVDSFNRVNKKYFYSMIESPNLEWGNESKRKLGSYEYGTDTITISAVFKQADAGLLDYIMYHELLHKKHKFKAKNGRSFHHTSRFRKEEKQFKDSEEMEKRMARFVRRNKFSAIKNLFRF